VTFDYVYAQSIIQIRLITSDNMHTPFISGMN